MGVPLRPVAARSVYREVAHRCPLRRHFVHAVGAGPKRLHRVRRFQRFLRLLGPLAAGRVSLAGVAADLGWPRKPRDPARSAQ